MTKVIWWLEYDGNGETPSVRKITKDQAIALQRASSARSGRIYKSDAEALNHFLEIKDGWIDEDDSTYYDDV